MMLSIFIQWIFKSSLLSPHSASYLLFVITDFSFSWNFISSTKYCWKCPFFFSKILLILLSVLFSHLTYDAYFSMSPASFALFTCLSRELSHSLIAHQMQCSWIGAWPCSWKPLPGWSMEGCIHWSSGPAARGNGEGARIMDELQFLFCDDEAVELGANLLLLGFNLSWPTIQVNGSQTWSHQLNQNLWVTGLRHQYS